MIKLEPYIGQPDIFKPMWLPRMRRIFEPVVNAGLPILFHNDGKTVEDADRAVKQHMDVMKPGGGYVCGSSHSIVNYIPHQNLITMFNAIHKYGPY